MISEYDLTQLFPTVSNVPKVNSDAPEKVAELYNEAASILQESPRSACMLMRYCLETLLKEHVQTTPKDTRLVGYIKQFLIEEPWAKRFENHLTTVRLIGNEAVHGCRVEELDVFESKEDATQTALFLFDIINRVVEHQISIPKRDEEAFSRLQIPISSKQ